MLTIGEFHDSTGKYSVLMEHTKKEVEVVLVVSGQVVSAYKYTTTDELSFTNKKARDFWRILSNGIRSCKPKNGQAVPFIFGTSVRHEFAKSKVDYCIETYNGEICYASAKGEDVSLIVDYSENQALIPKNIPYIKLARAVSEFDTSGDGENVVVRTVEEIAMEKEDITWLKNKKYYIVNDDEQAEKIFSFLDNYNGVITYDTETTGLKINCFSKINSKYQKSLDEWNTNNPDDTIRADRLVGIIFCLENDVSYYFPASNRKFANLYENKDSEVRKRTIQNIKARYESGEIKNHIGDMADYVRNTPAEEFTSDVILMERVRNILETKHIVAHNSSFEWKAGWCYEIDTNIKDDTMILHQIMYKFRSTTSNRGEPSNLKYLAKRELGIDQWELKDFFPDFKEDDGAVRGKRGKGGKKQKSNIDFSYMDYDGTRIYAPTDGDVTYQLFMKYKKDLVTNHKEQEYIYNVEVLVSCAVAYMEFYGHRLDEEKIAYVREQTKAKIATLESEIRQIVGYSSAAEISYYNKLKELMLQIEEADKEGDKALVNEINIKLAENVELLNKSIVENEDKILNLSSPAQVSNLFYNILKIPFSGDKMSVAKKEIKALLKAKNEDGKVKYPIVHLYSEYKKLDTLMTKFFDNLIYFMYPGGYIFSSYGQISTATGRMSCSKPNAQQYPNDITSIVVPRPGYVMLDADYSQIEYRILVALAGEKHLAESFDDPDNDYHTLMAHLMYGVSYASVSTKMRNDAKSFNFGIPYGMGFKSLAILLTGMSGPSQIEEAKEKYELYFKDQPNVRKFFDQVKEMAMVNRYVKTFWNRYRFFSFEDKDGNQSNFKKASALRQAGNTVIQGTAADVFKISVARNFMYIRQNKLYGLLLISNMIHDEKLFEVNAEVLNTKRVLRDIGINMQFKVQGFPPLFVGAGIGMSWSKAKGKMAEIHPHLLDEITLEAENIPLFLDSPQNTSDVISYFDKRVYEFRKNKVKRYLLDVNNYGKDLHPAIGSLINMQFNYGIDKGDMKDEEYTLTCLTEFIKENNINVEASMFKTNTTGGIEIEEDKEYSDDEDEMEDDEYGLSETDFALIDESNVLYGSSIQDIIKVFGFVVSKSRRICGVDITKLNYKQKDNLADYLEKYVCNVEDEGSMQIIFLQESNILYNTGMWVKGIDGSEVETRIKMMHSEAC